MEMVLRSDVKQLITAIGCAALSVSLIGCAIAAGAERQQLWGEPGSRAAAAGPCSSKKYLRQMIAAEVFGPPVLDGRSLHNVSTH
jgi:hypothetical protein